MILVVCHIVKTKFKIISLIFILVFTMFSIGSCKNKNPSILKVYVRSSDNVLVEDASVIVVGDQKSTPATIAYVDSSKTNASGFAEFNMQTYFDLAGEKENPVGNFDVIAFKNGKGGEGVVRCKVHLTASTTVNFLN